MARDLYLRSFVRRMGWAAIMLALFCAALGRAHADAHAHKGTQPRTVDATAHHLFAYYPKHEYADCVYVIRISSGAHDESDPFGHIMDRFSAYLFDEAPQNAGWSFQGYPDGTSTVVRFEFADGCDIATSVIRTGFAKISEDISFDYTVLPDDSARPYYRPTPKDGWLDSEAYDPRYWAIRKAAYGSCNHDDWLNLARLDLQRGNDFAYQAYVYAQFGLILSPNHARGLQLVDRTGPLLSPKNRASAIRVADIAFAASGCN